ncbi:LysR family transcriptional regulator [Aureimonas ureilytica]|uniref:LysR family transcriptional regulator n=1 Tax=Aureimonas ureilytica TaxID=401562 RepID=A0A175R8J8_9HYPH|nr:LysR substrate-binding domain-containing protein [Aureimonas ureilytica]KTQ95490.1 LysR family transcriptional regulator [Aureimonas ureilytica]
MSRNLPPLAALRAFEAAARHLSFTKAAAELGMTQAAVSYQIKILEERVGAPLFLRGKRQIALTEVGERFGSNASQAFDLIADAFEAARGGASGVLTISVIPTFATGWLARHLYAFQLSHPELAVRLQTTRVLADFEREGVDIAIRGGPRPESPLVSHLLLRADFTPMLSPALEAKVGLPLGTPADLLHYPLIDPTDPWWNEWFAHAGIERPGFDKDDGHKMGGQDLEAIAAAAGHGVAILTPFFYKELLASGQLRQPFDLLCPTEQGYWLCYPPARRTSPKIRVFREWLLGHFPEGEKERSSFGPSG